MNTPQSPASRRREEVGVYYNASSATGDCPDYLPQSRADAEEDIRFYTALLTLNPKMVEDYIKRGNAYCYIGEYTKAIADYSAAIALKPNHLKAYYRRGVAYAKNTEYAKAISDYNEVIQRAPKQAEVYQRRGEAWYRLKEQEKAKRRLEGCQEIGDGGAHVIHVRSWKDKK